MSISKGIALITGSAQGIGRSIALRLARDGFDIGLNDIVSKRDQLRAVADDIEKLGQKTHLVPGDVSIEGDVKRMVHGVTEQLGGLDVMVANAGIAVIADLGSTSLDDWNRAMSNNACGAFLCYKYAAAQMIKQGRGGRIIGATSIAGKVASPLTSAYSASKFAIRGLTQAAALELGRYNITVNTYAPGGTNTPMAANVFAPGGPADKADKEYLNHLLDQVGRRAIKHEGQPEDIASVVSYLASKEAHFITGQCIAVDGGAVMS